MEGLHLGMRREWVVVDKAHLECSALPRWEGKALVHHREGRLVMVEERRSVHHWPNGGLDCGDVERRRTGSLGLALAVSPMN